MSLEKNFQANVIKKIKREIPGSMVLKNDANYIQGIPDILVLYKDRWGALEFKQSASAKKQPNQEHYILKMNEMSFASFISPENEREVLDALQRTLESDR